MGIFKKAKKLAKKTVGKAVKKLVPKELAGIMQVAAPLAGPYAPLVYAAGAYKQTGRINPIVAASLALPYVGIAQTPQGAQAGSFGLGNLRYGKFTPQQLGTDIFTARDFLGLRGAADDTFRGKAEDFLFGEGPTTKQVEAESIVRPGETITVDQTIPGTRGILGAEGAFDPIKGKLLTKKGGGLSPTKIATAVTMGLSLSQTQDKIKEEGQELGLADSEIAALQEEAAAMWQDFDTTAFRPNVTKVAKGGLIRTNLAMGSRPTEQESGLGGLPIEADMRYTGGFMPYGAKEKADDVPARLSKNEFVFTADAVRGAGGGDINTGAKRMYQSMKQLEQMGKRA
jgi:hypothetical protein